MSRRDELLGWIAKTRRTQQRLAVVLGIAAALALATALVNRSIGLIAFAIVALVAICGFWVTSSHIADWHVKLDELDRPPQPVGKRSRW